MELSGGVSERPRRRAQGFMNDGRLGTRFVAPAGWSEVEEESTMRSRRRLMHGAVVAAAVVAVAALGLSGCSMVSPESSWTGIEGSIGGTVRSSGGSALAGIDVRVCGEVDCGECVEYYVVTDASGSYHIENMELGWAYAYEMDYVVYVNRTTSSAYPIDSDYGTDVATVAVTATGGWYDAVIIDQGPGIPEDLID